MKKINYHKQKYLNNKFIITQLLLINININLFNIIIS